MFTVVHSFRSSTVNAHRPQNYSQLTILNSIGSKTVVLENILFPKVPKFLKTIEYYINKSSSLKNAYAFSKLRFSPS